MADNFDNDSPSQQKPSPGRGLNRREALGAVAASLVLGLSACTGSGKGRNGTSPGFAAGPIPSGAGLSAGTGRTGPAAVPSAGGKPYVPDFELPPVRDGLAPVLTGIPTKHPVVFLTIDDGITKDPRMLELMKSYGYRASLFLTKDFVRGDPGFFRTLTAEGSMVENHTVSHNLAMVSELDYPGQLAEITGMQNYAQQVYGRTPALFRPPGGTYSTTMRRAVASAGLKAIVDWKAKANAGHMDYQAGNALRPGDIVLMHFRPEFAADLAAFRQAHQSARLDVVLLEEFLGLM